MLRPKCGSYIFLPAQIHWALGFIDRPKLMRKVGWQHLYVIISRKLIRILYIYIYAIYYIWENNLNYILCVTQMS